MTYDVRVANALRHPRIRALQDALTGGSGDPAPSAPGEPHTHEAGDLPAGLVDDATLGSAIADHETTEPHQPAHDHPFEAAGAVAIHSESPHGLAAHALDGVFHSGAEVLPTTGQKNALAGTSGTPGSANPYVTDQDARLSDDRPPTAHSHIDADLPSGIARDAEVTAAVAAHADGAAHTGLATDAEVAAAVNAHESGAHAGLATDAEVSAAIAAHVAAEPHEEPGAGSEAFPVGSLFLSAVATDPATLLGYGTWQAYAAGRVLVGLDAGQTEFDTLGETGGAKTHTLTTAEMPSHDHPVTSQTATSGAATSYEHGTLDTSSAETEATEVTGTRGGGGAHNNLQPYIVVHVWRRTA